MRDGERTGVAVAHWARPSLKFPPNRTEPNRTEPNRPEPEPEREEPV